MSTLIPFEQLDKADLIVDAIYEGAFPKPILATQFFDAYSYFCFLQNIDDLLFAVC